MLGFRHVSVFLITFGILGLATVASGSFIPVTDPVTLDSLLQESLSFGDKIFSDFEFSGSSSGGAISPDPSGVSVVGGIDDENGDYGLRFFNMPWGAGQGQTVDVHLSFKVAVIESSESLIEDVGIWLSNPAATGSGLASISETVWDAPAGPNTNVLGTLSVSKQQGDGDAFLSDHRVFEPVSAIWVRKDILITGGTEPGGSGHVSEFFEFYSQVPEPGTLSILLLTSTVAFLRRKK